MSQFQDACAVVTGGASGIGAALARGLAERGARVAVADISLDGAAAVADSIGPAARPYRCDVSDRSSVEALAAAVARDFGGVDLVFANAGVFVGGPLTEVDPREFDWVFDINVRGVFNTVQAFAPALLDAAQRGRAARFVFTGSENSLGLPFKGIMTAYTATKHALLGLADGLRRDLDGTGVGVTIVCPGAVNTRIWDGRRARQDRYGGAQAVAPEVAEASVKGFASFGQDPDVTARLCLEGMAQGEFMVITDPKIRDYAAVRHREVEAALDRLDRRLEAASR